MKRKAKIEIVFDGHRFWFRVLGGNGEILVASETFSSRSNVRRAARRLLLLMNGMTLDDIVNADDL